MHGTLLSVDDQCQRKILARERWRTESMVPEGLLPLRAAARVTRAHVCCRALQWSGFPHTASQTSSTPVCMLSSTATSRRILKQQYTETHRAGTSGAAGQLNGKY